MPKLTARVATAVVPVAGKKEGKRCAIKILIKLQKSDTVVVIVVAGCKAFICG